MTCRGANGVSKKMGKELLGEETNLAQTEGISDEKVGNVRFDGVHKVEFALGSLDREGLEHTKDCRANREGDRLNRHATGFDCEGAKRVSERMLIESKEDKSERTLGDIKDVVNDEQ